jgi:pimeloyl-ACP methyl ester carboxylesterase
MPTTEVDGIRISYEDHGGGEPAFLCLTGWCSSRGRYERLVPALARQRRTLALDWRGHGESERAVGDFGQAEMVADALATIEAAAVERVIPVAASHSGWVAIDLRRRLGPDRVPAVVHMDWMVLEPPERYMAVIRQLQSPETWSEARDTLFRIWQAGVDAPEIQRVIEVMREQAGDMWMRSGREIAAAYERGGSPLATYERIDPSPTRVLHLYGQPPDEAYLQAQRDFAAAHAWFIVETVPARTHFAMVETPEESASAIERFMVGDGR